MEHNRNIFVVKGLINEITKYKNSVIITDQTSVGIPLGIPIVKYEGEVDELSNRQLYDIFNVRGYNILIVYSSEPRITSYLNRVLYNIQVDGNPIIAIIV